MARGREIFNEGAVTGHLTLQLVLMDHALVVTVSGHGGADGVSPSCTTTAIRKILVSRRDSRKDPVLTCTQAYQSVLQHMVHCICLLNE